MSTGQDISRMAKEALHAALNSNAAKKSQTIENLNKIKQYAAKIILIDKKIKEEQAFKLNAYQSLDNLIKKSNSLISKEDQISQIYNKVKNPKEIITFQEQIYAFSNFNEKFLQILYGVPQRLVFVFPNQDTNEEPTIIFPTLNELVQQKAILSKGKNQSRAKYDTNKIKKHLNEYTKNLEGLNINNEDPDKEYLKEAYYKSLQIYKLYQPFLFWKIINQQPHKEQNEQNGKIYTVNTPWYSFFIGGAKGDLAEAYASFYFDQQFKQYFSKNNSHSLYNRNLDIFIRKGIAYVDNVSGLYTADIILNNILLSVKSLSASTAGFSQILELCNIIIQKNIGWEEIKNFIQKKAFEKNQNGKSVGKAPLPNSIKNVTRNKIIDNMKEVNKIFNERLQKKSKSLGIRITSITSNITTSQLQQMLEKDFSY